VLKIDRHHFCLIRSPSFEGFHGTFLPFSSTSMKSSLSIHLIFNLLSFVPLAWTSAEQYPIIMNAPGSIDVGFPLTGQWGNGTLAWKNSSQAGNDPPPVNFDRFKIVGCSNGEQAYQRISITSETKEGNAMLTLRSDSNVQFTREVYVIKRPNASNTPITENTITSYCIRSDEFAAMKNAAPIHHQGKPSTDSTTLTTLHRSSLDIVYNTIPLTSYTVESSSVWIPPKTTQHPSTQSTTAKPSPSNTEDNTPTTVPVHTGSRPTTSESLTCQCQCSRVGESQGAICGTMGISGATCGG
jgi:hypothetical protein